MVSDKNLGFGQGNRTLAEDRTFSESDSEEIEDINKKGVRERLGNFKKRIRNDSKIDNKSQRTSFLRNSIETTGNSVEQISSSYPEISILRNYSNNLKNNMEEGRRHHETKKLSPFEMVREVWRERERIHKEQRKQERIEDKIQCPINELRSCKSALQSAMYDSKCQSEPWTQKKNDLYEDNLVPASHDCTCTCCLKSCKTLYSKERIFPSVKANRSRYKPIPISSKPSCTCWKNRIPTGFSQHISRMRRSDKDTPKRDSDFTNRQKTQEDTDKQTQTIPWVCCKQSREQCDNYRVDASSVRVSSRENCCCIDDSDYWLYRKTGMLPSRFYLIPRRGWLLPQLCCYRNPPVEDDDIKQASVKTHCCCSSFPSYHACCLRQNMHWYKRMCANVQPKSELDAVFETMKEQQTRPSQYLNTCRCQPEKTKITKQYKQELDLKPREIAPYCISSRYQHEFISDEESSNEF